MKELSINDIVLVKFSKERIQEIIKEYIFENCKDIANIGNDITDIDSFVFFTDENNLEVVSAFSHCEANLQINTVKKMVDSLKDDLDYNEPFSQKVE